MNDDDLKREAEKIHDIFHQGYHLKEKCLKVIEKSLQSVRDSAMEEAYDKCAEKAWRLMKDDDRNEGLVVMNEWANLQRIKSKPGEEKA